MSGQLYIPDTFAMRDLSIPWQTRCSVNWLRELPVQFSEARIGNAPIGLGCSRIKKRENGGFLLSKKINRGGVRRQSRCLREKGQEENGRWSGTKGGWPRIHTLTTCCLSLNMTPFLWPCKSSLCKHLCFCCVMRHELVNMLTEVRQFRGKGKAVSSTPSAITSCIFFKHYRHQSSVCFFYFIYLFACVHAAVSLIVLVHPSPLGSRWCFPGGLWCVSGHCTIRGISPGLTAQKICGEMPVG